MQTIVKLLGGMQMQTIVKLFGYAVDLLGGIYPPSPPGIGTSGSKCNGYDIPPDRNPLYGHGDVKAYRRKSGIRGNIIFRASENKHVIKKVNLIMSE